MLQLKENSETTSPFSSTPFVFIVIVLASFVLTA